MKGKPSVWRSACARASAFALVVAFVPLPVAAAESSQPTTPRIDFHAAIARAAGTARLAASPVAAAQEPQGAANDPRLQSPSFFRSPLGIAVITVVGAGVGYAIYSASHDRIHSPYPR